MTNLCLLGVPAKPKLPPDFEKLSWGKLKDAVQAVFAKRPVSCSMEELYVVCDLIFELENEPAEAKYAHNSHIYDPAVEILL